MAKSIQEYINDHPEHENEISILRDILSETELSETLKWGIPTYVLDKKNIVSVVSFKTYFGLWFFQGVFLKDRHGVLINAQKDKTIAQRQWRFTDKNEIDKKLVLEYLEEAIQNQREGLELKPLKKPSPKIPELLQHKFKADKALKSSFSELTKYKQQEYLEYIITAKQEKTKIKRLDKIIPMIKQGIGLSDKYRK